MYGFRLRMSRSKRVGSWTVGRLSSKSRGSGLHMVHAPSKVLGLGGVHGARFAGEPFSRMALGRDPVNCCSCSIFKRSLSTERRRDSPPHVPISGEWMGGCALENTFRTARLSSI
jgi:hypothetical protein